MTRILHIDMDAFYASVEERERPELRGKPLVVGGRAESRGVVAAANYAARKFGVKSAMPMATAMKKCPNLIIQPPQGALYMQVSREINAIFQRFTPIIEPLSLDEAFLDPSGSERLHGSPGNIGKKIKQAISNELGLVASVGVAPNKFLAKLASDHEKPDGFTVIEEDQVQSFLDALPVSRLWGVGKSSQAKLARFGIAYIDELRQTSESFLLKEFGQLGEKLWRLAHGIDNREVTPDSEVKSVSQETTFSENITDISATEAVALGLTEQVGYRLREAGIEGRTINVKIRFHDFRTITRSRTLPGPSNRTSEIWSTVKAILGENLSTDQFALRLVGVGMSNFSHHGAHQSDLFSIAEKSTPNDKSNAVDTLSDEITRRYGKNTIRRGKTLT